MNFLNKLSYSTIARVQILAIIVMIVIVAIIFNPSNANAQVVKYRWPMGSATTIQNYFDRNTSASYYRYDCAVIGGYNGHTGTDTGASYGTPIYAAASGELYSRNNSCTADGPNNVDPMCGGRFGNHVRIKHTDSKVTIYAHMKYNSPAFNQSLLCTNSPGTKIGEVGSSGESTYNHLHFELWSNTSIGTKIDPFSGSCSQTTSYWVNQNNGAPARVCQ